jgi:hypothetical protein
MQLSKVRPPRLVMIELDAATIIQKLGLIFLKISQKVIALKNAILTFLHS